MTILKAALLLLGLCLSPLPLFASSVTNEGPAPVKISIRSTSGITGGGTLLPGQSMPIRQSFQWLQHIPEGNTAEVRIKIVEDSGATGYITTSGGRYTSSSNPEKSFQERAAPPTPIVRPLQPGYAINHSNVQLYITFISSHLGAQRTQVILPSQTITIPKDTVEVRTQPLNTSFADINVQVEVLMPDGSRQTIQSAQGSVYLSRKVS
ncbi:MAG: hypothetical protein KTQ49_05190 [Candidatus Omnitrophica bacterium]|nr:hypothetical protein [Candidatus Omnitrophota bacterium]